LDEEKENEMSKIKGGTWKLQQEEAIYEIGVFPAIKKEYVYLKLGYDADKITKEDAIAMLNEGGGVYPDLLSLEEITDPTIL